MRSKNDFVWRRRILPKSYSDYPLFLFISLMIPITFWFQLWVVFLSLFPPPSPYYYLMVLLGTFAMQNVVGNFVAILVCDTSINGRLMPDENLPGVKYCINCESYTPPRSYHCPTCDVCILKRDHHCVFTSCCIGHYNHRYFIHFMIYMGISVLVCLPFNIYFLWDSFELSEFAIVPTFIFPIVLLFLDLGPEHIEAQQIYIILFTIQVGGLTFCLFWLYFHIKLVLKGAIVHEMRKCVNFYNLGKLENIKMVFGSRWYLTWISPLIGSELPCDGIHFPMNTESVQPDRIHLKAE